jgi:hypothetical protein
MRLDVDHAAGGADPDRRTQASWRHLDGTIGEFDACP